MKSESMAKETCAGKGTAGSSLQVEESRNGPSYRLRKRTS